MPELTKEEKAELQEDVIAGQKLHELIGTPGWKDVLKPRFAALRQRMINEILSTKLDLTGFLLLQQSVNALDTVLKGIDFAIAKGDEAEEKLKHDRE